MKDPRTSIDRLVRALGEAKLLEDAGQVLDMLWLADQLPRTDGFVQPSTDPADPRQEIDQALLRTKVDRTRIPTAPPRKAEDDAGETAAKSESSTAETETTVTITLSSRDARASGRTTDGIYGHMPSDTAGRLRARAVRVSGTSALRDAQALARALKPLGRRRSSRSAPQFDEEATVERFAETMTLVPQFAARRERFFDALLLVEESTAWPLWRSLVDELEVLLQRRAGLRSLRRLTLTTASPDGAPRTRSRTGVLREPAQALEGELPLVMVVTDGTSVAWSDGRMLEMLEGLSERASVVVIQLLPERLWANTPLGAPTVRVRAPEPGAAGHRLDADPSGGPFDRDHSDRQGVARQLAVAALAVPIVGLNQTSLSRWSRMIMAGHGASAPAGLLWRDHGEARAVPPPASDAMVPPTPEQRVARMRAVAPSRVLQAAVYLSAAAPLNLAVVRLVHRVMQPEAPAEDLPLLLLTGLLTRVLREIDAASTSDAEFAEVDDHDILFEFPEGVRALLQRSLLQDEVRRIRRAVSAYIAERAGLSYDFIALIEDPSGEVLLPPWARPFAEISRELDALFRPQRRTVEEMQIAPGVSRRARIEGFADVRELLYFPRGQRLAALHAGGCATWRLPINPSGFAPPDLEPVPVSEPCRMVVVVNELRGDVVAALIQGLELALASAFNRPWDVSVIPYRRSRRGLKLSHLNGNIHAALAMSTTESPALYFDAFQEMPWMALSMTSPGPANDLSSPILWSLNWEMRDVPEQHFSRPPQEVGAEVALALIQAPSPMLSSVLKLPPTCQNLVLAPAASKTAADTAIGLLAVDTFSKSVVSERPSPWTFGVDSKATAVIASHPERPNLALIFDGRADRLGLDSKSRLIALEEEPIENASNFHWSPTGEAHAVVEGESTVRMYSNVSEHESRSTWSQQRVRALSWASDGQGLAILLRRAKEGDRVSIGRPLEASPEPPLTLDLEEEASSISWSPDSNLLAVTGTKSIVLVSPKAELIATIPLTSGKKRGAACAAFSPRMLDERFFELAISVEEGIDLWRIDPEALRIAQPITPRKAKPVGPSRPPASKVTSSRAPTPKRLRAADVDAAIEPIPQTTLRDIPDDVVQPALAILQGLVESYQFKRASEPGAVAPLGPELVHLLECSPPLFSTVIRRVLICGMDPVQRRTTEQEFDSGARLTEPWRKGEIRYIGESPYTGRLQEMLVALDTLKFADPRTFDRLDGERLLRYVDLSLRCADPSRSSRLPKATLNEVQILRDALRVDMLPILAREETAAALGRYTTSFYGMFSNSGPSALSRAKSFSDYLKHLFGVWHRELPDLPHASAIKVSAPVSEPQLQGLFNVCPGLAEGVVSVDSARMSRGTARFFNGWTFKRPDTHSLLRDVSGIVMKAVDARLSRGPKRPVVLWVENPFHGRRAGPMRLRELHFDFQPVNSVPFSAEPELVDVMAVVIVGEPGVRLRAHWKRAGRLGGGLERSAVICFTSDADAHGLPGAIEATNALELEAILTSLAIKMV